MTITLLKLMLRQLYAQERRRFGRSLVLVVILTCVLGSVLVGVVTMVVLNAPSLSPREPLPPPFGDDFAAWLALGCLLAPTLPAVWRLGLTLTPAEIDQIVPAPFSARQLVAAKLLWSSAWGMPCVMLIALPLQFGLGPYLRTALALTLLFLIVNVWTTALTLLGHGSPLHRAVHRALRVVPLGLLVVAAGIALTTNPATPHAFAHALNASWAGASLLEVPRLFVDVVRAPEPLLPLAIVVALLVLLWALTLRIAPGAVPGVIDLTTRLSPPDRRFHARGLAIDDPGAAARWTLPMLPRLGGAGPLLWRHLQSLGRAPDLVALIMIGIPVLCVLLWAVDSGTRRSGAQFSAAAMLALWAPLLIGADFRGDQNVIVSLKALPMRPLIVTLAQVAVPCLLVAGSLTAAVTTLGILHRVDPLLIGLGVLIAVPVGIIVVCVENEYGLRNTTLHRSIDGETPPTSGMGYGNIGRFLLYFFFLHLAALVATALINDPDRVDHWRYWPVALGVVCVVWAIACVALRGVVRAFERFDFNNNASG
jgi:hypothetical protein